MKRKKKRKEREEKKPSPFIKHSNLHRLQVFMLIKAAYVRAEEAKTQRRAWALSRGSKPWPPRGERPGPGCSAGSRGPGLWGPIPWICPGTNPATVLRGREHPDHVAGAMWGKTNKQICRAEEQRPGHVFPINLALPEEKSKTPCYGCQRCYGFCRKEGGKEGRTRSRSTTGTFFAPQARFLHPTWRFLRHSGSVGPDVPARTSQGSSRADPCTHAGKTRQKPKIHVSQTKVEQPPSTYSSQRTDLKRRPPEGCLPKAFHK